MTTPEEYLTAFSIDVHDLSNIQKIGQDILPDMSQILDDFYAWMGKTDLMERFFPDRDVLSHVMTQQKHYWEMFFSGNIDNIYIENRYRIGATHAKVGLTLESYYASVIKFKEIFDKKFREKGIVTYEALQSLYKLIDLDVYLVVDTYHQKIEEKIRAHSKALLDLSTPIAQIWDGILFLPLVGIVDSARAQEVMTRTLDEVVDVSASVFIIDIGGIAVMDTAVANYLIKLVKATKLMGCTCIIAGVSSSVAQTIVELGINTDEILTTNSMKRALQQAFQLAKTQF